ncbi:CCA tRNA nucleotidyltransferase [Sinisalibacter aestuarii]|uniref:Poly(A) polymerase n=1 Tax=Sinisalibacter aestuarii TaxID=2949426 RepID=A0ABQ5LNB7_9RHOB|nr:CCA tRNA nucleotidyltransferase [Sinisalibacter aestuarii]GKY86475.1 poly(A) polymerase [Sinisalibacter aestuarii]
MSARITDDWLRAEGPQAVCAMLTRAGHQAWFVGGCVRNALLGEPITDIDITTDATPEQVTELAKLAGFHPVPTGFEHGTVTVVVHGAPFEVTTFRRDVETDGRRAVVAYAGSIEEDAHRRDFTMNALYAAPDGRITDPLGGLPDLAARRVRFIDDACDRIREDYLRILRFFRFHAWYGDPENGIDEAALAAIAELSAGLETLSRERVGAEIKKLLAAPDPGPSVAAMVQAGVLHRVLPGADAVALPILVHHEQALGVAPDPLRRLACLGGDHYADRLRLSKAEARHLGRLVEHRGSLAAPEELGYRLGADEGRDVALLSAALLETTPPADLLARLAAGAKAVFPVRPRDLMPDFEGQALGNRMRLLEDRWIASGFTLGRDDLLANRS